MPGTHAILSPSAAHRWMNCTAAPRLELNAPDNETDYAREGTLAHAYCAQKLKKFLGIDDAEEVKEIAELNEQYHTGEMDEYTDTYRTIVLEKYNAARAKTKDAMLLVEVRLDFSEYVPDSYGTSDAIIIADGCLEVCDFKYGKGVKVSAEENEQMMIYALGAYLRYSFEYNIDRVRMTIIQPRLDNLSEYEISVYGLLAWAEYSLRPKARMAYAGAGPQHPGEWCQFCKVKTTCRALANKCLATAENYPDPKLVSKEDMETRVLPQLATIKTWLAGTEEYSLQQALSGVNYAGFKVVEGRSVRKITNQDDAAAALSEAGYSKDQIYKPQELRTITDLEKLVGKKAFTAICGGYIVKPAGKPTLVPESDKRPAYNTAGKDFKNIDIND